MIRKEVNKIVKKAVKIVALTSVLLVICFTMIRVPLIAQAQNNDTFNIPRGNFQPNYDPDMPKNLVDNILDWFFVIAAIICVAVIVWAGITYATAGGDEEKVGRAKNRLIYGIIGVVLIIGAFAITQIITEALSGNDVNLPTL